MKKVRLGIVQFRVGDEKRENLARAEHWLGEAVKNGAEVVVLPEMFVCPYDLECFPLFAECFPGGEALSFLAKFARGHRIYLVGGSLPERFEEKLYNASFIFGPQGELVGVHRKIHLFDVKLPGLCFEESSVLSPGDSPTVFDTPWGKVGVMICYDVRFPELARIYALKGAVLVTVPAAFNHITGPLHWELTFRARALDNQVFMVGAAPAPHERSRYQAYGHSIVVNPWGQVQREMGTEEGYMVEEIDLEEIRKVREALPLLSHRREDLYAVFAQEDFHLSPPYGKLIRKA